LRTRIKGQKLTLSDIFDMDSGFQQRINFLLDNDYNGEFITTITGKEMELTGQSRVLFIKRALQVRVFHWATRFKKNNRKNFEL